MGHVHGVARRSHRHGNVSTQAAIAEPHPWKTGLAWLAFLGPFFFASYGFANWAAAQRASVGAIAFAWEDAIPFLPWTIVPYWIIDLLYGISLVLCTTRAQLRVHVARLLFVQCAAVLCFLLFPLRFTFDRPAVEGSFGWMFAALESFDQPFNQAPSLHVALLVVLWPVYLRALPRRVHFIVHATAVLIGASVLTTWQHHFIDVPTGAWLGALALWLLREDAQSRQWRWDRVACPVRRRMAAYYAGGSIACGIVALAGQGAWLWLLWPAATLLLVALVYLFGDGRAYGKRACGSFPGAQWLLFGPYFVGARINALLWTRHDRDAVEVSEDIYIGSIVGSWAGREAPAAGVIDLSAEIVHDGSDVRYATVPLLDLVAPTPAEIDRAVRLADESRRQGPVLVSCALGYSRSACVIVAWLVHAGMEASIDSAIGRLQRVRPRIVLGELHREAVRAFLRHARTAPENVDRPQRKTVTAADAMDRPAIH